MGNRFVIDLLLVKNGRSSGYQEYVFNLLNYFHQNRDEIFFKTIEIWCKDTEKAAFDSYKDKFVVKGFSFSSYLKRFWLQTILPISERLDKSDLLFSPGNTSGLIKRCNELLTIHDLLYKRENWLPNKMMRRQRNFFIPKSIKKADTIIAISEFTKSDVEHYYPFATGKIEVIYNSMNFNKFLPVTDFQTERNYFLAICSNAHHKNLKTVLRAFEIYCKNGGGLNLVFVGKISSSGEVSAIYNNLPDEIKERIILRSNISNSELGGVYQNASCYLSASLFEGLGMPVVEAMSFDLPVILSDIPPHREVSLNQGDYFSPENENQLAEKMLNMDLHKKRYSDRIKDIFSENNTAAKYIKIINNYS